MHDGDVLVVTHGGVVRVVERHLGGDAEGLIPNLGGLWLEHDGAGLRLATGSCCSTIAGHDARSSSDRFPPWDESPLPTDGFRA